MNQKHNSDMILEPNTNSFDLFVGFHSCMPLAFPSASVCLPANGSSLEK